MRRLIRWFSGQLCIYIGGEGAKRFLAICARNNILLHRTRRIKKETKDGYLSWISLKDYKRIGPIARKCHTVPIITKRRGFPFVWKWVENHNTLTAGIFIACFILLVLQNFCWSIQFEGNFTHTEEQLTEFLREQDIAVGGRIALWECEKIETLLRTNYPDIIWVSAEKRGTRLLIRIQETFQYEEMLVEELEAANLVAGEDGVITKIIVRTGEPVVKEGDVVAKGDILVSGVRIVKDAYDVELSRSYVVPDADVVIASELSGVLKVPWEYEKKEFAKKEKHSWSLAIGNKQLFEYTSSIPTGNCDIMTEYAVLCLGKQFLLPVSWTKKARMTFSYVEATHTEEEIEKQAKQQYLWMLEDLQSEGYLLLEETSAFETNEEGGHLTYRILVNTQKCLLTEITMEQIEEEENARNLDERTN